MRAFLDTNVLLDSIVERENPQFSKDADAVLKLGKNGTLELCMSILSVPIIAYVVKSVTVAGKRAIIKNLTSFVEVLPALPEHVIEIQESPLNDIEDALQLLSAKSAGCDFIVTRDLYDFLQADIPAITPEQLLSRILE
jgi:predicted nucleic acid-binding protein